LVGCTKGTALINVEIGQWTETITRIHYTPIKAFLSCLNHFRMSANGSNLVDWQAME
jgi:hypothetical protein